MAQSTPHLVITFVKKAVAEAPSLVVKVKEDISILAEERKRAKEKKSQEIAEAAE